MTGAVVLDLDGVLIDSEQVGDHVRRELVGEVGDRRLAGSRAAGLAQAAATAAAIRSS